MGRCDYMDPCDIAWIHINIPDEKEGDDLTARGWARHALDELAGHHELARGKVALVRCVWWFRHQLYMM